MNTWYNHLRINPTKILLKTSNPAIKYFITRDFLNQHVPSISDIWNLPQNQKIWKNQLRDGSWKFHGHKRDLYPPHHYSLVETWKQIRLLIQHYEMNKKHPHIAKGCEFILSCQAKEGDIRGMIGNQYATYYTGAMLGILIQAGYHDDPRIIKGLDWLISIRQNDGGWSIPILTHNFTRKQQYRLTSTKMDPVEPDRSKPFSHNWTDMVLRGFVEHPIYRNKTEVLKAANLLKSRFFKKDTYTSYQDSRYWTHFSFWWPNLLTSMEILQKCGFTSQDLDIRKGLKWFIENQNENGLWDITYPPPKKISNEGLYLQRQEWLCLRIMRLLRNFKKIKER